MIGDIRKFRFWCQKVLPLVYDDSLSYYEILCKVVQYLNKVIEDVNSIPDYIDGVIDERLSDEHLQELIETFVRQIEDAISSNNEGDNTNSSADYNIGQLLWLNGILYKVIRQIDAGDTFIVDTNIEAVNFEDMFTGFIEEVKNDICNNDDGTNTHASKDWDKGDWLWLDDELYIATKDIPQGVSYIFEGANMNVKKISVNEEVDVVYDGDENSLSIHGRVNGSNTFIDKVEVEEADGNIEELLLRDSGARSAIDTINGNITTLTTHMNDKFDEVDAEIDAVNTRIDNLKLSVYYNVKDYGALGDGVTDDSKAINAVIELANTAGGGTVFFPAGVYKCDNVVLLKSNVNVLGDGGAVLDFSGQTSMPEGIAPVGGIMAILGIGSPSDISSLISMSGYTVTVNDASAYSVGDLIEVYSTTQRYNYQTTGDGAYYGELAVIESINGNTITVDRPATVTITENGHVRKLNPIENVIISNLKVVGSNTPNGSHHGIYLAWCNNVTVNNCVINAFDWYSIGVISSRCVNVLGNNITGVFYNGVTGTIFYGIAVMNDSYSVIVANNHATKERHLYVNSAYMAANAYYGTPFDIVVTSNIAIGMMGSGDGTSFAYEHHGSGFGIIIANNIARGCYSGANIEGGGVLVTGNRFDACEVAGVIIGDAYQTSTIAVTNNFINSILGDNSHFATHKHGNIVVNNINLGSSGIFITNNDIICNTATSDGIYIDANIYDGAISNNNIRCYGRGDGYAINIASAASSSIKFLSVINNVLDNVKNGIKCATRTAVCRNYIATDVAGAGIDVNGTDCLINGNEMFGANGITIPSTSTGCTVTNNILLGGSITNNGSAYTQNNYVAS